MRHSILRKTALAGLMLALLGACSNEADQLSTIGIAKQALGQLTAPKGEAGAADTPDAMAARALEANPAPLILAGFEILQATHVLAQTGENRRMRTYMTPRQEALILRDGLLIGTRGLGHDLSVAEPGQMTALIHTRRAGTGQRVMRYIGGDGIERPLPMTCTTATGSTESFAFAGRSWTAMQVQEACAGGGVTIQNSYLVTADGQIPVSRQWIGPDLGYVTVQVIRP